MSIKDDVSQVLKELSPIIAGFKLAVIVISYFGLGSLAKWFIEHWYPFTRRVWDWVAISIYLPEIPVPVKDSLTAFVFFLPLGITAIYQRLNPSENPVSISFRAFAGFLGLVFFLIVTKDVLRGIFNGF